MIGEREDERCDDIRVRSWLELCGVRGARVIEAGGLPLCSVRSNWFRRTSGGNACCVIGRSLDDSNGLRDWVDRDGQKD